MSVKFGKIRQFISEDFKQSFVHRRRLNGGSRWQSDNLSPVILKYDFSLINHSY